MFNKLPTWVLLLLMALYYARWIAAGIVVFGVTAWFLLR